MAGRPPPLRLALTDALTNAPLDNSSVGDEAIKDASPPGAETNESDNCSDILAEASPGSTTNKSDECGSLTARANMPGNQATNIKDEPKSPSNISTTQPPSPPPSTKRPRNPKPITSPFWNTTPLPPIPPPIPKTPRPPPNTVSSLPIPPLTSPSFGLIQESLASDPFALLVATTFLTKTKATAAIPVFRQLMDLHPTPEAIASADEGVVQNMMQPLGLSYVRTKKIQRMARTWIAQPPEKGKRFGVRNYPSLGDGSWVQQGEVFGAEDGEGEGNRVEDVKRRGVGCAWEIGHVTTGAYALDSWRMFCRDVLLGRAEDWKGGGRGGEFQPEWMRVLPRDKELRACLRWLWMKEGWEWDAVTGEREVLREGVRRAVDEGRVGYDERGELVVVDEKGGEEYGGHFQGRV
ncbi:DNA glycosylase [Podospora aff. communis PSN243]|uniref:DNA glycosylase n=1 Tax=Podospora aff. communis PSN243 TaxID=3040156 RepID=A0AAV9GVI0_9PEZI|nr:DNA glycosylase [Podospora aff. communis PSN243]